MRPFKGFSKPFLACKPNDSGQGFRPFHCAATVPFLPEGGNGANLAMIEAIYLLRRQAASLTIWSARRLLLSQVLFVLACRKLLGRRASIARKCSERRHKVRPSRVVDCGSLCGKRNFYWRPGASCGLRVSRSQTGNAQLSYRSTKDAPMPSIQVEPNRTKQSRAELSPVSSIQLHHKHSTGRLSSKSGAEQCISATLIDLLHDNVASATK